MDNNKAENTLFLATYSNSESAVLDYTSIFETSVRRVKVVEFQSSLPHKGGQMAYMNQKSRRNDKDNRYSEPDSSSDST